MGSPRHILSPMMTIDRTSTLPNDPLISFGATLSALKASHPRRIGLLLGQLGILLTVGGFCISIAAMNIGLVASLAGCLMAGASFHRLPTCWAYIAFLTTLALSTILHGEWGELVKTAVIPLGLLTGQVVLHHAVPGAQRLRRALVIALLICVTLSTLLVLAQFFIGRGRNRPFRIDPSGTAFSRTSGFFGLHLTQGGVMAMLFFLAPALAERGWRSRGAWPTLVAAGLCNILSGARSALIGLAAGWFFMVAARGRRHLLLALVGSMLLVSAGLMVLFTTQRERFDRLVQMEDGRWPLWKTSLVIIADHPLIGTGASHFRETFRVTYPSVVKDIPAEFPKGADHAHNTQLAHAAEHGIPFALAWLIMLGTVWLHLWRHRHEHPLLFHSGTGMIVMALTFGQFEKFDGECSRVLWTGAGLLLALLSHPRSDASTPATEELPRSKI